LLKAHAEIAREERRAGRRRWLRRAGWAAFWMLALVLVHASWVLIGIALWMLILALAFAATGGCGL